MLLWVAPELFPRCHPEKKIRVFRTWVFIRAETLKKQGLQNLEIFPEFEINLDLSNQTSEYRLKSRLTTTVDKGGTLGALIWITFIAKLYPHYWHFGHYFWKQSVSKIKVIKMSISKMWAHCASCLSSLFWSHLDCLMIWPKVWQKMHGRTFSTTHLVGTANKNVGMNRICLKPPNVGGFGVKSCHNNI